MELLEPGVSIKPIINLEEVNNLVYDLYDLKVENVKELNGYDDKNYRITVNINNINKEFVFKIVNTLDSKKPELFDAQNKLQFELRKHGVNCPIPIANKTGEFFAFVNLKSGKHIVRLLEYINGLILHQIQCTPKIFYQAGKFLGEINNALKNFHQPIFKTHKTIWMMENVPQLQQFVHAITDNKRKELVKKVIDEFSQRVLKIATNFECGMIHGDFNEQNILVEQDNTGEWNVKGVIDFGDSQYSCYLFELAIAMTYMIIEGKDVDVGGYVLAGYRSVRNLPQDEFNLLKICIQARLCQSLVMGAYSSLQDPENTYILSTSVQGWNIFNKLLTIPEDELLNKWDLIARNFKMC